VSNITAFAYGEHPASVFFIELSRTAILSSSSGYKKVFPFTKQVVEVFKPCKSETWKKQIDHKEDLKMLAAH